MGQRRYYGVRARMKGVEIRMAEEFATCCGVNLAGPEFWGVGFFPTGIVRGFFLQGLRVLTPAAAKFFSNRARSAAERRVQSPMAMARP
jgi:hypothetical protein